MKSAADMLTRRVKSSPVPTYSDTMTAHTNTAQGARRAQTQP